MASAELTVKISDMEEVKALVEDYKKLQKKVNEYERLLNEIYVIFPYQDISETLAKYKG
jgi:hypothetical protein